MEETQYIRWSVWFEFCGIFLSNVAVMLLPAPTFPSVLNRRSILDTDGGLEVGIVNELDTASTASLPSRRPVTTLAPPCTETMEEWEEYFAQNPAPRGHIQNCAQMEAFCQHHVGHHPIALVTSGGTTVPLERNTVRSPRLQQYTAKGRLSS
ncbi:Phosphopantothenate--cysteine ligase CAB2 [Portunus trituberculatus]|uniref:Phosphopantothenate--cysteine ligase CAB2 n=1 Tax=Portunus trituberculatus TaxID=210409 RepID=A0A5B7D9Y9_PORTR|nr:Phosphopantothenate--cysteine ligase CAB2 [Portunus trituberculatus]